MNNFRIIQETKNAMIIRTSTGRMVCGCYFLLFLLIICNSIPVFSQDLEIGNSYKTVVEIPVQEFSILSADNIPEDSLNPKNIFEAGMLFRVVELANNKALVRALLFNNGGNDSIRKNSQKELLGKYYLLKVDNTNKKFVEPSERITIGLLTLPFKVRFPDNDRPFAFAPDFNISSTFGYRLIQTWDYSTRLYGQVGVGISTISLNSSNSNIESTQNISAITLLTGLMVDYKGIQVGIYLGWDSISNNEEYLWDFHRRRWFSLGIGFGLFEFWERNNN